VVFKTRGRSGLNAKQITVTTNDPATPTATLIVKADLEVELKLEPEYLDFGRVRRGSGATQTIQLAGVAAAKAKVLSVEVQQMRAGARRDAAAVVTTQVGAGGQAGSVAVSLLPDAPAGRFVGMLQITTDHPGSPPLQFRVVGEVQASVQVQPARVQFQTVESPDAQTRVLTVSTADEGVSVLAVEVDHPALSASIGAQTPGRTRIDLTFKGALDVPHVSSMLRIRTSSAEDPLVEVPVELFRASPRAPRPPTPTGTN
jgi:hypothetical protein